jgi:ATP-binding protein involved in chromosome partitioning
VDGLGAYQLTTLEKNIETVLNSTVDPHFNLNAHGLSLKPLIHLEGKQLSIDLCAGFPCASLQKSLCPLLQKALHERLPDYQIQVTIDQFIKAHQTQLFGKGLRGVKNTIAIASGKGGVGKSTVAVNVAIALARSGARVGILDADIYGPSIPLMLGKSEPVQISGDRYLPIFSHGVHAMSIGYLTEDDPALIWRGPMLAKSMLQLIDITQWDALDYLLIDLPPGTGDIQLSLVQKIPLTAAIIVTTPQTVATLDAEKALKMFAKTNIDVLGIIENMSTHICSHCGHQEAIFSQDGAKKLCNTYQCRLLGQIPLDARIASDCDEGTPTAVKNTPELSQLWMKTALGAAIELSKKPLNYADKFPNIVVESKLNNT